MLVRIVKLGDREHFRYLSDEVYKDLCMAVGDCVPVLSIDMAEDYSTSAMQSTYFATCVSINGRVAVLFHGVDPECCVLEHPDGRPWVW